MCHLLALLGAHHILHVSRIRVKLRGMKPAGQVVLMKDNLNLTRKPVDKSRTEKLILRYDL